MLDDTSKCINMETKHIAAIVVTIIVIAGVCVALTQLGGGGDESYRSDNTDGRLMIYGNANNDDYIDQNDIDYLESIIAGDSEETAYADANQDGRIDQNDIDMVQRMINGESMTVYYYNDLIGGASPVSYPVEGVVPILAEVVLANKILGNDDNVRGYMGSMDPVLFSDLGDGVTVFSESGNIPIETLSKLDVDAVVSLPTSSYITNESEITQNGISVIRLGFRDADPTAAYLTYGFLIGQEDRANRYAQFVDQTLDSIEQKISENCSDSERIRGMVLGYNVIYGRISDYGNVLEMAGAVNAVDWYEHRYVRDGMEWLYEYDFDYIVGRVSQGGYDYSQATEGADVETVWNNYNTTYALTEAGHNGSIVLINTSVPTIINAAYLAAIFYPDIFGSDYGDEVHQEYIDLFIDNLAEQGYDVSDGLFVITEETIGKN